MPKQYRLLISVIVIVIILIIRFFILEKSTAPTGPYFGQTTPDSVQVFAPGFVSDQFNERDAAFSPAGDEFYFSLWTGSFAVILCTKQVDGKWTRSEIAPFCNGYSDIEPFITSDGSRLYFASSRPVEGNEAKDYDIWFVERMGSTWGDAQRLDSTINTPNNEFYPTLTTDGTLYFTARRDDSFGGEDIYRSEQINGVFQQPEHLGDAVNSVRGEFNALIAPDESFLLFSSFGRPDGLGGGDLYISFNVDGVWQSAVNLGEPFNSDRLDYCPAFTPDGAFFLFTSSRSRIHNQPDIDLKELKQQLLASGNGNDDIYWVQSNFINEFRRRVFEEHSAQ